MKFKWDRLLTTCGATFTTAWITKYIMAGQTNSVWYHQLTKSMFNPPGFVFGIVWPLLYASMAFAAYFIWKKESIAKNKGLQLFFAHLLLHPLWGLLFFRLNLLSLAFITILFHTIVVGVIIFSFYHINRKAGLLFVPYLCWMLFATYLNGVIVALNPAF